MSEYQYYEFQTIDRPLTAEQQAAMRKLSSRVALTTTSAAFNYSYGDFRGNPLQVLEKHFDAMLYIANWGSRQLAFRFPSQMIQSERFEPYMLSDDDYPEAMTLQVTSAYTILNIDFDEEEGDGWIEGDGMLDPLIPIREELLRGDLRALYLIWLKTAEWGEDDEIVEPPVPPGLGELSPAQQALCEFFGINEDFVAAAAEASATLKTTAEPLEQWVTLLPPHERDAFLVRVARGEPHIGIRLLQQLRKLGSADNRPMTANANQRTIADLRIAVKRQEQQRTQRERAAAERVRLAKLDDLAAREAQIWAHIPGLLAQRNASGYDQAVAHLKEMHDLAVHRNQRPAFDARLQEVIAPYASSTALQRRLKEQRLV